MSEFTPMVIERDGVPMTTSRAVAEQFGKRHTEVLRSIDNLLKDLADAKLRSLEGVSDTLVDDFAKINFIPAEYTDAQGKPRPMYLLTRDGFALLTMGFTGAKALRFKVAYIDTFNRMEQMIRSGTSSAALSTLEKRLEALETTAGNGTGGITNGAVSLFLQAIQRAIDNGTHFIRKPSDSDDDYEGKFLGFICRDCIALKRRAAFKIYAADENVIEPLPAGILWDALRKAGKAHPEEYRNERVKSSGKYFIAIFLKSGALQQNEKDR